MQAKPTSAGKVTIIHMPLPEEANHDGNVYGGNILRHMDAAGGISAKRHARCSVVTAAVEYMSFLSPVKPDELMLSHAQVNAVFNTSMEIGIRTEAENPITGALRHVCTCYMTFVGVDENGRPIKLPGLISETAEDLRRLADATRRMAMSRIEHRRQGMRMSGLRLELLPGAYSVCKLGPEAPYPDLRALPPSAFVTMTRTGDELSLVLDDWAAGALAQDNPAMETVRGLVAIKVAEAVNFHTSGLLAGITILLASAAVPVFAVSTYLTSYVFFEAYLLQKALERLKNAGHSIQELRTCP